MTFIITLISLIIERFFHWRHLRHWRWFATYQRWLSVRISKWPAFVALIVCVVPLLFAVGIVNWILGNWLYGLLRLLFGVIVLVYCLGPNNFWVQVYSCIASLNKDDPNEALQCVQTAFGIAPVANSQAFHQAFTRAIFVKAYRRIFAVIFWFVLLGPVGAVFYRALTLCTKETPLNVTLPAIQIQRILDWIPVRIFTFLFALAGHFTQVFNLWKMSFKQGLEGNTKLLGDCGVAALSVGNDNAILENGTAEKEAVALLDRVFVIVLVLLAVTVLVLF